MAPEKRKPGRPTEFKPEYIKQAAALAAYGATDEGLASFFGVNPDTIHRWKRVHPEFSESIKTAKHEADMRVVRSLFERATGYNAADTHFSAYEGVVTATPYTKHYPPDPVSMIFWLKNRQPKEWRDKHELDHKIELIAGVPNDVVEQLSVLARRKAGFLLTNGGN